MIGDEDVEEADIREDFFEGLDSVGDTFNEMPGAFETILNHGRDGVVVIREQYTKPFARNARDLLSLVHDLSVCRMLLAVNGSGLRLPLTVRS